MSNAIGIVKNTETGQVLKKIRSYEGACLRLPATLDANGEIVAKALLSCFEKQEVISEGLVTDIVFGFAHCVIETPQGLVQGLPASNTVAGLINLEKHGLVRMEYQNGEKARPEHPQYGNAFVRYLKSFQDMFYES